MIEITTATGDLVNVAHDHDGAVRLGQRSDGTPAVEVRATYAPNDSTSSTTVVTIEDADFADELAHALMAAADHLRGSDPGPFAGSGD